MLRAASLIWTDVCFETAGSADKGAGDRLVSGRGQHRSGVHQHPGLRSDVAAHGVRGDLQGRQGMTITMQFPKNVPKTAPGVILKETDC